jgi:hypothetical protein
MLPPTIWLPSPKTHPSPCSPPTPTSPEPPPPPTNCCRGSNRIVVSLCGMGVIRQCYRLLPSLAPSAPTTHCQSPLLRHYMSSSTLTLGHNTGITDHLSALRTRYSAVFLGGNALWWLDDDWFIDARESNATADQEEHMMVWSLFFVTVSSSMLSLGVVVQRLGRQK